MFITGWCGPCGRGGFCATRVSPSDLTPRTFVEPSLPSSSALSSCYSRVYQSLANLIRWSDQVMLEGVNSEDKEMVTSVKGVIKAVLDGVKVWWTPDGPRQRLRVASLLGSSQNLFLNWTR